jgi:hypothetical protein
VIQRHDPFVWAQTLVLGKRRVNGQPTNQNSGNEENKPAHDILPCFEKNPPLKIREKPLLEDVSA